MIITAEKISKGSFFKLLFIGFSLGLFIFFFGCGVAALLGAETVHHEGEAMTGFKGFIVAMGMWPIFSLFMTCFFWAFGVIGLWIYSFFKPLNIRFKGKISTTDI